ncbi:hypothetical protein B1992_06880 [Pseudoxanthomonas broegbernensis]|uniref:Uncharacterized protein n=1 Tax=Pseudoxanthomonas broegbernensis TaxID=83619 RepID=A0A7V8K728_9GAMM|nr:hypothetical protein [Pseudoxanthomonas broegbernensis]KAF1686628.1 hypothetical protein B1992_06880 [Pseudoxanthomonas broegbernensis]MBB6063618.1 hypothetical protein [Pseudoxanthomonas broegbernensis]
MTRRGRTVLLLAAGAATGVALGAAWPPPPIPKSREDAAEWTLPADALERLPRDAVTRAGQVRWLGEKGADGDGQASQEWRLAGILQTPQPVALVVTPGKQKQSFRLEPGATLPDGSRLAAIEGDTATVERGACTLVYQLHRSQPIRTSGPCSAGTPDTE